MWEESSIQSFPRHLFRAEEVTSPPLEDDLTLGKSISYQKYFPALYVSSDFKTAFSEKFQQGENESDLHNFTELDFALRKPDSFSFYKIRLCLSKIIDLREMGPINNFYNAINHIEMPSVYEKRANTLKVFLGIIKSSEQLKKSIFDPNYEQWDYWIDCPSSSQWFGHYTRLAGIQGVIYPSIRVEGGFNIAIFPDQFKDTSSYVALLDKTDSVKSEQKRMDAKNFNIFI